MGRFGQAEAIRALLLAGADHTIKNREDKSPQTYGMTNDRTKGMQPTLNVLRVGRSLSELLVQLVTP